MRKQKIFIKITSIFLVLLLLTSCGEKRSAEDVLFDVTKDFDDLPDGNVYLSSAKEGSQNFLSVTIINSLYHEGAAEYEFSLVEEYAIYISEFAKPCEIAVYKCYSASDTDLIASMCLRRIEKLCVMLSETSFSYIPQNADIDVKGHFVIVTMV